MTLENSRLLLKMGDVERAKSPKKTKTLQKQQMLRLSAFVTT